MGRHGRVRAQRRARRVRDPGGCGHGRAPTRSRRAPRACPTVGRGDLPLRHSAGPGPPHGRRRDRGVPRRSHRPGDRRAVAVREVRRSGRRGEAMTTDPFTEAARKQSRWEWDFNLSPMSSTPVEDLGQRMAEWARTHLAAQEPTDAEVDAVAASILWETSGRHWEDITDGERREYREYARAALSAARTARRDEEER